MEHYISYYCFAKNVLYKYKIIVFAFYIYIPNCTHLYAHMCGKRKFPSECPSKSFKSTKTAKIHCVKLFSESAIVPFFFSSNLQLLVTTVNNCTVERIKKICKTFAHKFTIPKFGNFSKWTTYLIWSVKIQMIKF